MKRDDVMAMLCDYRYVCGRKQYLTLRVSQLERWAARERDEEISGASLHAQVVDGMPRSTDVGRPVERLGVDMADGTARIQSTYADELAAARAELEKCTDMIGCVDALLMGLDTRERFLVRCRYIDHLSWRGCCLKYREVYCEEYSEAGLRKATLAAMEKVFDMAA